MRLLPRPYPLPIPDPALATPRAVYRALRSQARYFARRHGSPPRSPVKVGLWIVEPWTGVVRPAFRFPSPYGVRFLCLEMAHAMYDDRASARRWLGAAQRYPAPPLPGGRIG